MKHFLDESGISYGVKEILDTDGVVTKWEKVNFKNYDLLDIIDKLVENEIAHGEKNRKRVVTYYGDSSVKSADGLFVRFVGIQTAEFCYCIYKTEEERDKYYNQFN